MDTTPGRPQDLTAKARIRNAAFTLIARHGVDAASVRRIAAQAGVSSSLVRHHFGSKEGVVDAVSSWVVEAISEMTRDASDVTAPAEAHRRRWLQFERATTNAPLVAAYVRRMLLSDNPSGLHWFKRTVDDASEHLIERANMNIARPVADPRITAAMIVILGFAPVILRPQLEHALDLDFDNEHDRARWGDAQTELLSSALYPEEAPKRIGPATS
jgi:AcrR family transcriptional regulator